MGNVIRLIFFLCLICLIIGMIKPSVIIRWGILEKRNRKSVLKYYGTGTIIIFILVGIYANKTGNITDKSATVQVKSTVTEQPTEKTEEVAKEENIEDNTKNVDLSDRWNEDNTFKLDSKSNTDEAEMEIYHKAKEDVNKFKVSAIPKVINFIKADSINPWKDNASMERMIYFGTVLANSEYTTESEKQVGDKAKSTTSYVYRGKETTDEAKKTQASLTKLINKLK